MDGMVQELKLLSGHPVLAKMTLEAAWKWRYLHTVVNGTPVEVETEIDVKFTWEK
jgi:protein TonB